MFLIWDMAKGPCIWIFWKLFLIWSMVKDPCIYIFNTIFLIWGMVKDLCSWIFYRQILKLLEHRGWELPHLEQLYKYLWIFCRVWWVMPWTGLLAWYIILVRGCTSTTTRFLVQDICPNPSFNSNEEVPWFLDLWSPRAASLEHVLPRSTEIIETADLIIHDAEMAFRRSLQTTNQTSTGYFRKSSLLRSFTSALL